MTSRQTTAMPVLICFDGSASARQAIEVAAKSLGDAPVVLLHVWSPPDQVVADAFGMDEDDRVSYERLEAFARARAAQITSEGRQLAEAQGLSVTPLVERNRSTVWKTILDVSEELDTGLVVAGTHGATAVETGLLGSVSNALLHHASRPVLVVPNSTSGTS